MLVLVVLLLLILVGAVAYRRLDPFVALCFVVVLVFLWLVVTARGAAPNG